MGVKCKASELPGTGITPDNVVFAGAGHLAGLRRHFLRGIETWQVLLVVDHGQVGLPKLLQRQLGQSLEFVVHHPDRRDAQLPHVHRVTHGPLGAGASSAYPDDGVVDLGGQLLHVFHRRGVPRAVLVQLVGLSRFVHGL